VAQRPKFPIPPEHFRQARKDTGHVGQQHDLAVEFMADFATVETAGCRPLLAAHLDQKQLDVDAAASNFPIFQLKRGDAPKFADIVCDKDKFTRQRRHCDQQVIAANGCSLLLQIGANISVNHSSSLINRHNLNRLQKFKLLLPGALRRLTLCRAIVQTRLW
jgi:hypothetical protein